MIAAAAFSLDIFRPQANYAIHGLRYDSASSSPYTVHTPVQFPTTFDLRFDALAYRVPSGDAVQAFGLGGPSLEFHVFRSGVAAVMLFHMHTPIPIIDNFTAHKWRHFDIRKIDDEHFTVSVDRSVQHFLLPDLHQSQSSAEIGWKDFAFRFGTIVVGGGGNLGSNAGLWPNSAQWRGKIAHLSFTSRYVEVIPRPESLAVGLAIAAALLWLFWPWLACVRLPSFTGSDAIVFATTAVFTGVGYCVYLLRLPPGHWAILLGCGAGAIAGAVLAKRLRFEPALPQSVQRILLALAVLFATGSLALLPNSITMVRMFWRWPLASTVCLVVGLCVTALALDACREPARHSRARRWAVLLPYAVFALLAIRCDSLIAPINTLHWEYVLGPMRALRDGGWLLWDVPSQYGFLNVLIPAFIPLHPVMEAFYAFQALVLFVASAVLYRTLCAALRLPWVVAALVVVVFFYLADPLLIGPSPYPSMSSVRFLWSYILLAVAANNFLGERPSIDRFVRTATPAWIVALLWSAESAIYATVIFFTPVLISILRRRQDPLSLRETPAVKLVGLPIVLAAAAFWLVDVYYIARLGHSPDWSMYVMYILSYGSGFGEIFIPLYGPIGVVLLVLAAGAASFAALRRKGMEAPAYAAATAFSLIWIVTTYYVGRAFPVVVSMLTPLIIFAAFTIFRANAGNVRSPLVAAIIAPLLALGAISTFWNANIPYVAPQIASLSLNAWIHFPTVDPELASLLARAGVDPSKPVVYYGGWVAMPRVDAGPFDRNWLPTPLQELETPIAAYTAHEIVKRYVARHQAPGFFIQSLDGSPAPQAWIDLISHFYNVKVVDQSVHYRIYKMTM